MEKYFLITYDLSSTSPNYQELYDKIKEIGDDWQHPLDSTWIVKVSESNIDADVICKKIRSQMRPTDGLFVVAIDLHHCQGWLPKLVWEWINSNVRE